MSGAVENLRQRSHPRTWTVLVGRIRDWRHGAALSRRLRLDNPWLREYRRAEWQQFYDGMEKKRDLFSAKRVGLQLDLYEAASDLLWGAWHFWSRQSAGGDLSVFAFFVVALFFILRCKMS